MAIQDGEREYYTSQPMPSRPYEGAISQSIKSINWTKYDGAFDFLAADKRSKQRANQLNAELDQKKKTILDGSWSIKGLQQEIREDEEKQRKKKEKQKKKAAKKAAQKRKKKEERKKKAAQKLMEEEERKKKAAQNLMEAAYNADQERLQ